MNFKAVPIARLVSQKIAAPGLETAAQCVAWMGGMQAQDFRMSQWAIGLRLPGATETDIRRAIDSAEIIRTHLLRPTWHFVSATDIYWMLNLTAPHLKAGMKGRHKALELNDKILKKCNSIIEDALVAGKNLTRKELVAELNKHKIATDNNRSSHIFLNAELEGLICSGKIKGSQPTYALLGQRVPSKKIFNKEESLCLLATKYFQSHSPATFNDFLWWSGLPVTEARQALEMVKGNFFKQKINESEYWFNDSFTGQQTRKNSIFLLPAFDEYLISYKDRSASICSIHESKAFSKNGIFWPTIIANGKVEGTWKREIQKDRLMITARFFDSKFEAGTLHLKKAAEKLGLFLNCRTELVLAGQQK